MSKRRLPIWKLIAYSGLTLLLFVVLAEGASRMKTVWDTGNWRFLIWRPKEVFVERQNNVGFRGPDMEPVKPQGAFRVAALGGSTTFGWGSLQDEDTYPRQLEALLRKWLPDRGVEVINAGLNHGSSADVLERIPRVLELGADILLIYSGYNDYNLANIPLWGRVRKKVVEHREPEIQPDLLERLLASLSVQSVFFLRLREKLAQLRYGDVNAYYRKKEVVRHEDQRFVPLNPELRGRIRRALDEMIALYRWSIRWGIVHARERGTRVILGKLPVHRGHPGTWHMIQSGALDALNRAIEELGREYGVPVADVPAEFNAITDAGSLFTLDYFHLSPRGNAVLAVSFAKTMKEAGYLPR